MRCGHEPSQTSSTAGGSIDAGIDPTLVDTFAGDAEELTNHGNGAHEPVPDKAIHEVREPRERTAEGNDAVSVEFIDPHLVLQEPEQRRLRMLDRIPLADIAKDNNPE